MSRATLRNIWIEFASAPGVIEGGICAADTLTKAEFLDMVHVVFSAHGGFETYLYGFSSALTETDESVPHGIYVLKPNFSSSPMRVTNRQFYPRTLPPSSTYQDKEFCTQACHRDGGCVISGLVNYEASANQWIGFNAAHIFPVVLGHIFASHGFQNLITHHFPLGVNSPQNGLLLSGIVHPLWDNYSLAVNPHKGFRVQAFRPNAWAYQGNILNPVCRHPDNPISIIPALLRWHYEQAVLCNMRGSGEPSFEFDFPPGTDMMEEIREDPYAAERMEAELYSRLYGYDNDIAS